MKTELIHFNSVKMPKNSGIRVVPAERIAVEIAAASEQMNISEYIRSLIRDDAKKRGIWQDALERALALGAGYE